MTKESTYELQRIDCNCNDCSYLLRALEIQNTVLDADKANQQNAFDLVKERKIKGVQKNISNLEDNRQLIKNAERKINGQKEYMKLLEKSKHGYQGQRKPIQYGICKKFQKSITFIPNITQLETQKCFIHRKDYQP